MSFVVVSLLFEAVALFAFFAVMVLVVVSIVVMMMLLVSTVFAVVAFMPLMVVVPLLSVLIMVVALVSLVSLTAVFVVVISVMFLATTLVPSVVRRRSFKICFSFLSQISCLHQRHEGHHAQNQSHLHCFSRSRYW